MVRSRTIHQILIKVKKLYIEDTISEPYEYTGLCSVLGRLDCWGPSEFTYNEIVKFKKYFKSTIKDQTEFYNHLGNIVNDPNKFAWPMYDTQPRIDWLDKHIELTKPKSKAKLKAKLKA